MKLIIAILMIAVWPFLPVQARQSSSPGQVQTPAGQSSFTLGKGEFLLNGKPFLIRAGEVHFPRIPRPYWDHRIKMLKAMGMNTVCIYLFWNFHEQSPGNFDFSGQKDVSAFVKLIQANGMYCIVRPGPYACAEWDMGGLPWWLLKKQDIKVRTLQDSYFMERSERYLREVGKQLAPLQIQNGGPVLMVQVENEYGAFGKDSAYMEATRKNLRLAGFDKVQLMRCDWSSTYNYYKTDPEVAVTLNFGAGSDVDQEFSAFKKQFPEAPLMCSEYWTGWFDNWGRPHETRSIASFIGSLKDMLQRRISFSLYMAHGGTTFGQWGGANSPSYSPMVTSYDYNAPIDEQGRPTDKFFAVRELLKNYLNPGEKIADIPSPLPVIKIPGIEFREHAALFDNLPAGKKSAHIRSMEFFDQGWGRINYRTHLDQSAEPRKLIVKDVHDWAAVFVDGKLAGKLDRRRADTEIEIPATRNGAVLDILVEATGRVNFGEAIIDRKGITERVEIVNGNQSRELTGWEVFNFPVDYAFQKKAAFSSKKLSGPGWYKANFTLEKTGDTYLDLSSWGKGMVWVNGHNIGRFWKIGPQQTLLMPGIWLKQGKNEIVVLDLEVPQQARIQGLDHPIIDQIYPDASLLVRKAGQNLDLSAEKPVLSGSFAPGKGWQQVTIPAVSRGRYLCLEALSEQGNGNSAGIAELQIFGPGNKQISSLNWKLVYADSEEITAANHAGDKVYDNQESTFWQSRIVGDKAPYPHQLVIDLGEATDISSIRYLPRTDKSEEGMIKDFRIYIKAAPFKM